ncbi:peptidoglycan DD-metalloendopeptidase family protein [Pengzhenrongella sp.]|jgi:murein DD-endopeptidase MepM/ murein hydrolase activator NlpD|uniref:peptidoglycan DD-metalloendopeptidase family protein n=1 Tax=Pengzhenrongella sp. TaxID=2888820 RepID=UPI002F94476F
MEAAFAVLATWAKAQAIAWLRRNWLKIVAGLAVLAVGWVLIISAVMTTIKGTDATVAASNACRGLGYQVDSTLYRPTPVNAVPPMPTGGAVDGFGPGDGAQLANARAIIGAGKAAGVSARGMVVAIAVALQESGLQNLDHGDRDSVGIFQQRPSQGWGTPTQIQDPDYSARAFYGGPSSPHFVASSGQASPGGLLEVDGWKSLPITDAAQRVQRSGFPGAYAKHEARATRIVAALSGDVPLAPAATAPGTNPDSSPLVSAADYRATGVDIDHFCAATFQLTASVTASAAHPVVPATILAAGTWTAPLKSRISSEFGMRLHPIFHDWRLHAGTDFQAAIGTPLAAASAGVVKSVSWWGGGGLTVAMTHPGGIETYYLHLSQALVTPGDPIQAGQIIALSGASGVGTGAHFHFEIHDRSTPVDPVPFMASRGVDLRAWSG